MLQPVGVGLSGLARKCGSGVSGTETAVAVGGAWAEGARAPARGATGGAGGGGRRGSGGAGAGGAGARAASTTVLMSQFSMVQSH
jgi:hypothetical protein